MSFFHFDGPAGARPIVALAHGAGAGLDSAFMNAMAQGLAARGLRVARFEFPYMAARRQTTKQPPPDREPVLRETWLRAIAELGAPGLVIGGKSLGGRIASLVADDARVAGLICLGYPFHPTGKPDKLRVEHLRELKTPTLILQGERDSFGNRAEVEQYELSAPIRLHWLPDGDHSFKPRKASGRTEAENWREAIDVMHQFIQQLSRGVNSTRG